MQNKSQKTGSSKGMTLVEMTISMAILGVIFAVLLPQLRLISNSWDSKAGRSDALQNGCVLLDHLQRTLQTARRITAVSGAGEALGYIEFEDNTENSFRYDIDGGTSYVEFGVPGLSTIWQVP
jgi:prepilin-type N-terminal cleavage/methylation domain-containing protein